MHTNSTRFLVLWIGADGPSLLGRCGAGSVRRGPPMRGRLPLNPPLIEKPCTSPRFYEGRLQSRIAARVPARFSAAVVSAMECRTSPARGGPNFARDLDAFHFLKHRPDLVQRVTAAVAGVEHLSRDPVCSGRFQAQRRDVLHIREVARLLSVAENGRRGAGDQMLHEEAQDTGVGARRVLARAIHIEESQRHGFQAETGSEDRGVEFTHSTSVRRMAISVSQAWSRLLATFRCRHRRRRTPRRPSGVLCLWRPR